MNPRPGRLFEESLNMLQLVLLKLLSILKSPSQKVPSALIKVVQLEKLSKIPLDEGRQGTTTTLYSAGLCTGLALPLYLNTKVKTIRRTK